MAKIKPLTELEAANLAPAEEYEARVLEAEEITRKATGAPQFKIKLEIFGENGKTWHVYDYLGTDYMEHRLRHFCFACGLGSQYEGGEVFDDEMAGQELRVKIGIEDDADFGPKNVVRRYIVKPGDKERSSAAKEEKPKTQTPEEFDQAVKDAGEDEIPF